MAALAEYVRFEHMSVEGVPMPFTLRTSVVLGDEELLAFSRRNRPYRIELNAKGELEIMSPVNSEGGRLESEISIALGVWAKANGGVTFSSSTGFRLRDTSVLSPDASWVSTDSWNALTRAEQRGFAPICPAFLIEIRSESDSLLTLQAKMQQWLDNGAGLAWMIDPYAATVSIYRPGVEVEVLEKPNVVEAGEPVAGFRLEMAKLWDK